MKIPHSPVMSRLTKKIWDNNYAAWQAFFVCNELFCFNFQLMVVSVILGVSGPLVPGVLKPVAMAEFWWGIPPSSANANRIHEHFYPSCEEKCRKILGWMI